MVHGCMVYTERAELAAVPCGTSHASAVSTPLRWIFKNARERRIALYKRDQQQQRQHRMVLKNLKFVDFKAQKLCEIRCGRPGLPVPNNPGGLCKRKATLKRNIMIAWRRQKSEKRKRSTIILERTRKGNRQTGQHWNRFKSKTLGSME